MSREGQDKPTRETRKGRSRSAARSAAEGGPSPLAALVRRHDRDRYLTALFAPAARRGALLALYAFNWEIARVREAVTQPTLGQIRLQWWREAIRDAYTGVAPRAHEVAGPLAAAIAAYRPSRRHFDLLIDARERDLVADRPPADLAALEDYAAASSASLVHLALEILGVDDRAAAAAAREVGIAYALAGLLRAAPFHARAGRSYLSAAAAAEALDPLLRDGPALRRAAAAVADAARRHLAAARQHAPSVPRTALPALLPAVVATRALARLRHAGDNPFDPRVAAPDPLLAWRLAAAMRRGRFL